MTHRVRIRAAATASTRFLMIEAVGTLDVADLMDQAARLMGEPPASGRGRFVELAYEEPTKPVRKPRGRKA